MRVEISSALLDRILRLASGQSVEICGLLLGRAGRIDAIAPATNVAPDPARHFELDPAMLIAAHRAARADGPQMVGHYHSHPSGVAAPSVTDAACAQPDGSIWLIVAGDSAGAWIAAPGEGGGVHFVPATLDIR